MDELFEPGRYLLPRAPLTSLDEYLATPWGGLGIARAVELGPEETIAVISASGLRGRGGGGFPTGRKWRGVRGQEGTIRYVVANGAEGEPGTFKDRLLMRTNPYQIVEGVIVAAFAVDAAEAFIAIKASFTHEYDRLLAAITQFQSAGICRDCKVTIVTGPDEYLFGEEKAMLEVIEGKAPLPRVLAPFEHGLFATTPQTGWSATEPEAGRAGRYESNPTLVNNVETLANVGPILALGAPWFRQRGSDSSPGNVVCTVVGDVRRAGVGEVELGTPLRRIIDDLGAGAHDGRTIKAVFSGVANSVVPAEKVDVALTYESFQAIGSGMGAGGFIVFDDSACMVEVARQFSRFLAIESCGQCPPCKNGSAQITALLHQIEAGVGSAGDIDLLGGWLRRVTDGNRCYLAVEEQVVVSSILRSFPEEFDEHLSAATCPRPRRIDFPKITDLDVATGSVTYDESIYRKQPDWTYR